MIIQGGLVTTFLSTKFTFIRTQIWVMSKHVSLESFGSFETTKAKRALVTGFCRVLFIVMIIKQSLGEK